MSFSTRAGAPALDQLGHALASKHARMRQLPGTAGVCAQRRRGTNTNAARATRTGPQLQCVAGHAAWRGRGQPGQMTPLWPASHGMPRCGELAAMCPRLSAGVQSHQYAPPPCGCSPVAACLSSTLMCSSGTSVSTSDSAVGPMSLEALQWRAPSHHAGGARSEARPGHAHPSLPTCTHGAGHRTPEVIYP